MPIQIAAAKGKSSEHLFKRLLGAGTGRNEGWLGAAVDGRTIDIVLASLQAGGKLNTRSGEQGRTPLHVAADRGAEETVRTLVVSGANIALNDVKGRCALHLAAKGGHHAIVRDLVLMGGSMAALTATDHRTYTPLHLAAEGGHEECVSTLLGGATKSMKKTGVNRVSADCKTPLFLAARRGHVRCVQTLLEAGADIDNMSVHMDMSGADIDDDSYADTPLEIAALNGHEETVKALLLGGADVNSQIYGWTALHNAASAERPGRDTGGIIRALVDAGADLEATTSFDGQGWTALHLAAQQQCASNGAMAALLQGGANVNARGEIGDTPLHIAGQESSAGAVELLLRWGADENLETYAGEKAADFCQKNGGPDDDRIRRMLAPAERAWSRYGWLVMVRHRADAMVSSCDRAKQARIGQVDADGGDGGGDGGLDIIDEELIAFANVVQALVVIKDKEMFRKVVGFL